MATIKNQLTAFPPIRKIAKDSVKKSPTAYQKSLEFMSSLLDADKNIIKSICC
jgi:hypothetical protein